MSSDQRLKNRNPRLKTTALMLALVGTLVVGCGSPRVKPSRPAPAILAQKPTTELASQLLAVGDTAQAAHVYAQLASSETDPTAKQELQLLATELYFDSELYNDGARLYGSLPTTMATEPLQQRRDIVGAYFSIAQNQPDQALQQLPLLRNVTDRILRIRTLEIQARAREQLGQPAQALKSRIQLEANLSIPESINLNHNRIWGMLKDLNTDNLRQMATTPGGNVYRGWIEYALLARSQQTTDPATFSQRNAIWQNRFAGHPAAAVAQGGIATAQPTDTFTAITDGQIALLLPLSGPFAEAGAAIKTGFIAARFADGATTSVKVYDTESDTNRAIEQYQLATAEGASLVIGPLNKSAVINLAAANQITVPTLSLNYVGDSLPGHSNLYQFGLLPEDEARDAANYAKAENFNKALILSTDSVIGQRLSNAFNEAFTKAGGKILGAEAISEDAYDYSNELTKLLAINSSHSRKRNLEKLLDTKIEFEPAIRADIDVIFMAVNSEHARLLKPQLKFHHAGNVPVLSTAMVFSGEPDKKADSDLSGVKFNDIPWLLSDAASNSTFYQTVTNNHADISPGLTRLMALGIDAYSLHNQIENMRLDQLYTINGKTGSLSLTEGNRIQRRLEWAQFQEGEPAKIDNALPVTAILPPLPANEL